MDRITLKSNGAILLGQHVSCDGFAWHRNVRVQTHIHYDHMMDFDTSKANQMIIMSPETLDLLNALFDADLPYRTNLTAVRCKERFQVDDELVELFPSRHMLGSVQVRVTCKDAYRVGYSSDFFWPVEHAIQVDELIVDATYGDPSSVRDFTQGQVDERVLEIVSERLRAGLPTAVIGHNGRLQHAMYLLADVARCPIVCSRRAHPLVEVYQRYGFAMPDVLSAQSEEALEILRSHRLCLAFVTLPERRHLPWVDRFAKVSLSAYMTGRKEPVVDYGNGDCCIAFTDHADFEGTLEYIKATQAKIVWTDPRSGNAAALATAVSQDLGIDARIAPVAKSMGWG